VNAIDRLLDALLRLRTVELPGAEHALLGRPTLSVGTVTGGRAVNLTPDLAEAQVDVRYLPGTQRAAIVGAVRDTVGEGIAIDVVDDKPPVEAPADHPFVRVCLEAVGKVRGTVEPPGGVSYFSDSNVLCPALGIPRAIIGPGALGMSGQRDEHVAVRDLVAAAEIFEHVARRWLA
jgi:succinyl-diaminopimelate desuccinylase